jgi:hypothetical protein
MSNEYNPYDGPRTLALAIIIMSAIAVIVEFFVTAEYIMPKIGPAALLLGLVLNAIVDYLDKVTGVGDVFRSAFRRQLYKDLLIWSMIFIVYFCVAYYVNA